MTQNKPKRGRPKKGTDQAKTFFLQVRLLESEREGFSKAAELAGVPLSTWVRERLRIVARKELEGFGTAPAFLKQKKPSG